MDDCVCCPECGIALDADSDVVGDHLALEHDWPELEARTFCCGELDEARWEPTDAAGQQRTPVAA